MGKVVERGAGCGREDRESAGWLAVVGRAGRERTGWQWWGGQGKAEAEWWWGGLAAGWLAGCGAVPACIDLCIDLRSRGERGRKQCNWLSGGGRITLLTLTPCSCPSGILYTLRILLSTSPH